MPAKTPKAAVDVLVARLRAIAGCVTDRPLLATGHRPSSQPHFASFFPINAAVPLRTRGGQRGIQIHIKYDYAIDRVEEAHPSFETRVASYVYRLLDHAGREILAYHWHPAGVSPITAPHLHLSSRIEPLDVGRGAEPVALAAMHLPTGHVGLAEIVRLVIGEFAIAPRRTD